jgi:hypothetical protein
MGEEENAVTPLNIALDLKSLRESRVRRWWMKRWRWRDEPEVHA